MGEPSDLNDPEWHETVSKATDVIEAVRNDWEEPFIDSVERFRLARIVEQLYSDRAALLDAFSLAVHAAGPGASPRSQAAIEALRKLLRPPKI